MRTVTLPYWPTPVSALGLGTASLGSRVSAYTGAASVERALQAGVTWFDTAPAYGDGEAEKLLGRILAGQKVAILTKVGLEAQPPAGWRRLVRLMARPVLGQVPALRAITRRWRGQAVRRAPLTRDLIEQSLEKSLNHLGQDRLAALALHEPHLDEVQDESVIAALHAARASGTIAHIALAGDASTLRAARAAGLEVDIFQSANPPFARSFTSGTKAHFCITHSVFGVAGAASRLGDLAAKSSDFRKKLAAFSPDGRPDIPALLLADAFNANPDGIVLTSAFHPAHLEMNCAAARMPPEPENAQRLESLLNSGLRLIPPFTEAPNDVSGQPQSERHGQKGWIGLP